MAIKKSNPTGDWGLEGDWDHVPTAVGVHYSNIDEGLDSVDLSDYVKAIGLVASQEDRYSFPADAPPDMLSVEEIDFVVHLNGINYSGIPGLRFVLYYDGADQEEATFNVETGGVWKTLRCRITGLSLTPAQYNALQVRMIHVPGAGGIDPEVI
jgi:hypothetical protein